MFVEMLAWKPQLGRLLGKKKEKKERKKEQSGVNLFSHVSTVGACSWREAASGSSPSWSKRKMGRGWRQERQSWAGEGLSGEFKQRAGESGKSSQAELQKRNKEQGRHKRASGGCEASDADDVVGSGGCLRGQSVSDWGHNLPLTQDLVLKGRKI